MTTKSDLLKQVSDAIDCMIAGRVAKDAVSHDPSKGQFSAGGSGSGGSGGGKGKGSSKAEARNIGSGIGKVFKQAESGAKKFPVGSKVKGLSSGDKPGEVIGHSGNMVHTTKGDFHVTKITHAKDGGPGSVQNGQKIMQRNGGLRGGGGKAAAIQFVHTLHHQTQSRNHSVKASKHEAAGESGEQKLHETAQSSNSKAATSFETNHDDRVQHGKDADNDTKIANAASAELAIKKYPSAGKHKP